MIRGIGNDIVEIARIRSSCEKYGDRFLKRIFTPEEQRYVESKSNPYPSLAARFAAKEALIKALRVGKFHAHEWTDAEVTMDETGIPRIRTYRDLQLALDGKTIHLSLTHSDHYASAIVIIEE